MEKVQELFKLREEMAELQYRKNRVNELERQRAELDEKVRFLDSQRLKEQRDVDNLERPRFTSLFYRMTGQMADRLDKEKAEAYSAVVKYNAANLELESVEHDLKAGERKVQELLEKERQYWKLLDERKEELKHSETEAGKHILKMEEELAFLVQQKKEIDEAVLAGNKALATAEKILKDLSSAQNWGTWDMLGGGMMISMAKHECMDDAQRGIEQLQIDLRRFQTELLDVNLFREQMNVKVDGFLRTADMFFDGFFVDWAVQSKIDQALIQIEETKARLKAAVQKLIDQSFAMDREILDKKEELEKTVLAN